ncbi:hypothetical protein T08_559 [Trichinella sp. T8]|nr:hypothetical protein T08_559 [Trichinella sp. T8]
MEMVTQQAMSPFPDCFYDCIRFLFHKWVKECYRLTKLNEGRVYGVVRGICLYCEWEFDIDDNHYRVYYRFKSVHCWLRQGKRCASSQGMYFL